MPMHNAEQGKVAENLIRWLFLLSPSPGGGASFSAVRRDNAAQHFKGIFGEFNGTIPQIRPGNNAAAGARRRHLGSSHIRWTFSVLCDGTFLP